MAALHSCTVGGSVLIGYSRLHSFDSPSPAVELRRQSRSTVPFSSDDDGWWDKLIFCAPTAFNEEHVSWPIPTSAKADLLFWEDAVLSSCNRFSSAAGWCEVRQKFCNLAARVIDDESPSLLLHTVTGTRQRNKVAARDF